MVVTQATGSEGSTAFVQDTASASALQGEVSSSGANTRLKIPFGVLGEYDPSGSTFGIGVAGISSTGYGVAAESFATTSPSLIAIDGAGGGAAEFVGNAAADIPTTVMASTGIAESIDAVNYSSGDAIDALSEGGNGISGVSLSTSQTNFGVFGSAMGGFSVEGIGQGSYASVGGINTANGVGLYGTSQAKYGSYSANVQTTATPGPSDPAGEYAGAYATSTEGSALYAANTRNLGAGPGLGSSSNIFVASHYSGATLIGTDGKGLFAYSAHDMGALIENDDAAATLTVSANSTSTPSSYLILGLTGNPTSEDAIFSVDRNGGVYAKGQITSAASSRNPGTNRAMYAPQQSVATVEDFGSAQLLNGSATVPLAADFADTVDASQTYMVFLTPYGDTRGLYVASRTASGFVVRETQGGRSNLAFDYRIVARPVGNHSPRMPRIVARVPQAAPVPRLEQIVGAPLLENSPAAAARARALMLKAKSARPGAPQHLPKLTH